MGRKSETWRGHYPITGFVLEALSKKDLGKDAVELSRSEKVLFVACSFWAAAAKGALKQYLGREAWPRLQSAIQAFSEIGAVRVASILRARIQDSLNPDPHLSVARIAAEIESHLAYVDENVDELIAKFAATHLREDLHSP